MVLPNENATYLITITNTGDVTDSYLLALDNRDSVAIAILNVSEMENLSNDSSGSFVLNASNLMLGTFRVNVTATSKGNRSLNESIHTTTHVVLSPVAAPACSFIG